MSPVFVLLPFPSPFARHLTSVRFCNQSRIQSTLVVLKGCSHTLARVGANIAGIRPFPLSDPFRTQLSTLAFETLPLQHSNNGFSRVYRLVRGFLSIKHCP